MCNQNTRGKHILKYHPLLIRVSAPVLSCSSTPKTGAVYPRFANTHALHCSFQPDSLLLEWEMRNSELVCLTVAVWMESGNFCEGLWPAVWWDKHLTGSSHFLSTSYLLNAFREEIERFSVSLKTNYPFLLKRLKIKMKWKERGIIHYLRIYSTGAMHTLYYLILTAIPQQSHFQMSPLRHTRISRLLRTPLVVTGLDWGLNPHPFGSKSLTFYSAPKWMSTCICIFSFWLCWDFFFFFSLTGQLINMIP